MGRETGRQWQGPAGSEEMVRKEWVKIRRFNPGDDRKVGRVSVKGGPGV